MFNDDRQLARSLLRGDERSFREFFDRFAPLLLGFVRRRSGLDKAAAEDVVQNTLMRALRALPGYRGEASLYTWMCQVCRSELADQRRASARRPVTVSMDQDAALALAIAEVAQGPASDEPSERVLRVLAALPAHQARVLEMKYASDMAVDEIARQLHMTPTAAQSLLARARDAFRRLWSPDGGEQP